jgi:hypothetical protein
MLPTWKDPFVSAIFSSCQTTIKRSRKEWHSQARALKIISKIDSQQATIAEAHRIQF